MTGCRLRERVVARTLLPVLIPAPVRPCGELMIGTPDDSSHSEEECGAVALAANRESHIGLAILREGQITFGLGRFGEAIVQNEEL